MDLIDPFLLSNLLLPLALTIQVLRSILLGLDDLGFHLIQIYLLDRGNLVVRDYLKIQGFLFHH